MTARSLFMKGAYQDVVDTYLARKLSSAERPWLVGALCFVGKLAEALELTRGSFLAPEEELFLCIGHTRQSQYARARAILDRLKQRPRSQGQKFFFYQAAAFYCYYLGRFKIARSLAQKAYLASLKHSESLWRMFAQDLIGHSSVQCGDIHQGLEALREGSRLARSLGNRTLVQATEISVLNYEAQFTPDPEGHKVKLRAMLERLAAGDNYSEGSLLLNLAHLELLTGALDEGERILKRAQAVIFGKKLARYMGAWHFEEAYRHFLSGGKLRALAELATAKATLNLKLERKLHLKILGFEAKILKSLGEDIRPQLRAIEELSHFIGDASSLNKLARLTGAKSVSTQDPLQSLFDEFQEEHWRPALFKIIQHGYLGILREKIASGPELLLVQGLWNQGLLFISPEKIHFVQRNVGRLPALGLVLLFEHERLSKEELVRHLWGYEYDPGRHDTLLYALIHRIRAYLGPFGPRLQGGDHFYRIVGEKKALTLETPERIPAPIKERLPGVSGWNIRQYEVLNLMREGRFWSVGEYAQHFSVTTMTALRDLSALRGAQLIAKAGKGRATRYGIFQKDSHA